MKEDVVEKVVEDKENEKKRKKRFLILFLCIVLLGGVLAFIFFQKPEHKSLLFDQNAEDYQGKIKQPVDWTSEKISFPSYRTVRILKTAKEIHLSLVNPSFNKANLQFTLYLNGQKEPLLRTGLVQPGKAVQKVPLKESLKPGSYKVQLKMKAYAQGQEKVELNGANTEFELLVMK